MPVPADAIGDLLDKLVVFLRTYVVMTAEQSIALALWVVHTHAIGAADTTPYLHVTAPTMRSGKTRVLEVSESLVRKPLVAANASDAALFRALADEPTLLFDEIDTVFGPKARQKEDLRALLNAGYRRGQQVLRVTGEGSRMTTTGFPVFGPKMLVGIGSLPSTLADRSLPLRLKRRTPSEPVERWRQSAFPPSATLLRDKVADWTEQHLDELRAARPQLPDELDDRAQDAYEPLLAIADLAGDDWSRRARAALVSLRGAESAKEEASVQLLDDIRAVFEQAATDRLSSKDIVNALCMDEEAPWSSWGGEGKPISANALARTLRQFGVRPRTVRFRDSETAKGYHREQFEDSWNRYVPRATASEPSHTSQPAPQAGFDSIPEPSRGQRVTVVAMAANRLSERDVTAATAQVTEPEPGAPPDDKTLVLDIDAAERFGWCSTCRESKRIDTKAAYPSIGWLCCGHGAVSLDSVRGAGS